MIHRDPDDAYRFLLELPRYALKGSTAYKPGLERIEALLHAEDDPHLRYPSIHVAGSNGKGSVASMIASILTQSGLRVGLHTSPHFLGLEERMRVGPEPASSVWVASTTERIRGNIEESGASFFEAMVLLSFLYFAERDVDVAVVEVGLGGRYDATNVLRPNVSAITEISLEHTDILGKTLQEVAAEKAGIMKKAVPTLTIARDEAFSTLVARASVVGSPLEDVRATCEIHNTVVRLSETGLTLRTPLSSYDDLNLSLAGRHQVWNAALAVRAAETFCERDSPPLDVRALYEGLEHIRGSSGLRGRMEVLSIDPTIIADNAHNPPSLEAVLAHVREFRRGRLHVVLGLMRDKDAQSVADLLARLNARVSLVKLAGERAFDPRELRSLFKQRGVQVDIHPGVLHAVDRFRQQARSGDALVLAGSHLIVGEALTGSRHCD